MATNNIDPNGDEVITWDTIYASDLTPNANGGTNNWTLSGSSHWDAVADYEDADYVAAFDGDEDAIDEFNFNTVGGLVDCQQVVVYLYCKDMVGTPSFDVSVDITNGGGYETNVSINPTTIYSWKTATFSGLSGVNQTDIDNLKVRITAPGVMDELEAVYIKGIYVRISHTGIGDSYSEISDNYDDSYIKVVDGDESIEDEYNMTTDTDAWNTSQVEVFVRGRWVQNDLNIRVDLYTGSGWEGSKLIFGFGDSWTTDSVVFDGLSLDKASLGGIIIKIIAPVAMVAGDEFHVTEMYATITYTGQPKLTNSDILTGTISQSEMGYQKANFTLKKNTTVEYDYLVEFTEDYTSNSSTGNQVIFEGLVEDYSLTDVKDITCVSKQDEVIRIQPRGHYQGLTTIYLSKMINVYKDYLKLNSYGPTTWTGYFDAPYNFSAQTDLTGTDIDWVDYIWGSTPSLHEISTHKNVLGRSATTSPWKIRHYIDDMEYGTMEFWIHPTTTNCSYKLYFWSEQADGLQWWINIDNDADIDDHTSTKIIDYATNTWYRIRVDFECTTGSYLSLGEGEYNIYIYDTNNSLIGSVTSVSMSSNNGKLGCMEIYKVGIQSSSLYFDAYGSSWDGSYILGDNASEIIYNLPSSSKYGSKSLSGGQSLQSLLTAGAILEKDIWAIAPDGDIKWYTDGDVSSGITLDDTIHIWDVKAQYQTKRINRVILKGAGGLEAEKNNTPMQDNTGQIIIYKDYRADITNQSDLDTMAQNILDVKSDPPMIVNLSMVWEAKGWIQVGENVTITGDKIRYNNSSSYIPAGDYRITDITYHIKDGAYSYIDLILADGLSYKEQTKEEFADQNMQNANYSYGGTITGSSSGGINNIVEDTTPQLGGALDTNGQDINDNSGDDIVNINDALHVTGNITTDGLVDGVDILSRDHAATVAGDLNLNDLAEKSHDNLDDVSIDDHHARTHDNTYHSTNYEAANANIQSHVASPVTDAHHTATVAGDLNHNGLSNIDADDIKHITATQLGNLHSIYTLEVHDNDEHDPDYASETRVFEQSETFPVSPAEGDFHYDELDDSLYRYNAEAEAWIEVGVGGSVSTEIDNLGDHIATEAITGITRLQGAGTITIAPQNDLDDELVIDSVGGSVRIFQEGSGIGTETGSIGHDTGSNKKPFLSLYVKEMFDDDGNLGSYSLVDDLQLIRDLKEWENEKPMSPDFPEITQKVWDVNTLPWVKAHTEIDKLENIDNNKRYALSMGAKKGFLLSVIKKLLEEIDIMKLRINDLEAN